MPFTDPLFLFYFLPGALGVHTLVARTRSGRGYPVLAQATIFLLTLFFYGFREPWWLLPFLVSVAFDFLWGALLARETRPRWRKAYLTASVAQNVILLALFKFGRPVFGLPLTMPAGISFYTFESLSFVIDVYRRQVTPPKRPLEFFAFIAMFPRFVAGPIVRYREMSAQFQEYRRPRLERGLALFVWGYFLKSVFADGFATFVPYAFDRPYYDPIEFFSAWIGVLAYAAQLYFDFFGYSLMAIGLARCLGFRIPSNFRRPYRATNLRDFWQRWHVTLSRWLRDYVYLPLGGRDRSTIKSWRNVWITMLAGGIWHGAGWTFVVWGAWHAATLCVERMIHRRFAPPRWVGRIATLGVVLVGWVFFRAASMAEASRILLALVPKPSSMFTVNPTGFERYPIAVVCCLLGASYLFLFDGRHPGNLRRLPYWVLPLLFSIALFLSLSAWQVPFLYFQF